MLLFINKWYSRAAHWNSLSILKCRHTLQYFCLVLSVERHSILYDFHKLTAYQIEAFQSKLIRSSPGSKLDLGMLKTIMLVGKIVECKISFYQYKTWRRWDLFRLSICSLSQHFSCSEVWTNGVAGLVPILPDPDPRFRSWINRIRVTQKDRIPIRNTHVMFQITLLCQTTA